MSRTPLVFLSVLEYEPPLVMVSFSPYFSVMSSVNFVTRVLAEVSSSAVE